MDKEALPMSDRAYQDGGTVFAPGSRASVPSVTRVRIPVRPQPRAWYAHWNNNSSVTVGSRFWIAERTARTRLSSNVAYPVAERNTNSADAIHQRRQGAHVLQANLRIDDSSHFGSRTTRALAYGLTAHEGIPRDDKCRYPAVELASSTICGARE